MKKRTNRYCLLIFMLVASFQIEALAQPNPQNFAVGSISAMVIDTSKNKPVEYANVILYNLRRPEELSGTITDENGYFILKDLRLGMYRLEIKFIGFHAFRMDSLAIYPGHTEIDLGEIAIAPDVLVMNGVEVTGEKPIIEFQIDKKVINVSKQFTTLSGTAVDVLENVPSVSVDIEGNVSLRGSTSFTLLIDGRPSVLDPNDALQTIPASTIENIEIVTNPSARYDPDGVAGIINIITKKSKSQGVTGIVNLSAGLYGQYGGDFLLSIRKKRVNYFFGADYKRRNGPGEMDSESRTTQNDTTAFLNSSGKSSWGGNSYGLQGGLDLNLSVRDLLRFSFRYGYRSGGRDSDMDYQKWTEPGTIISKYTSSNTSDRSGNYFSTNLNYSHKFKKEGHELSAQLDISRRASDEESLNELLDEYEQLSSGQRATESGPSIRYRGNLDYKLPLSGANRIEAGYQLRYSISDEDNELFLWNPVNGLYELQNQYSHLTNYTDEIQSTYLIYAGEQGAFGYQLGLRGEYTYRFIEMTGEPQTFSIDRWDFYPTFHSSLQFGNGHQVMASYTRRIDRPRGWELEPFITWMDAFNVRRGNPDLKPEFIDSYEAGYQKTLGQSLFSLEAYYRVTHDKVDRVRSIYDQNIFLHTTENIGMDYALGTELMLTFFPFKWWNLNLMGNLYNYRVEGKLYGDPFSRESFNWSTRMNHTFRLGNATRIQLSVNYESPSVSSQGRSEGNWISNIAIRQDFWNRTLSATLQVRDIFGSATREFTSEGPGFYSHNKFIRQPRMLSFTLTYNINNYKAERDRQSPDDEMDFEENGDSFQ